MGIWKRTTSWKFGMELGILASCGRIADVSLVAAVARFFIIRLVDTALVLFPMQRLCYGF